MIRTCIAAGVACGSAGLPVVDMIEVSVRTRDGMPERERLRDHPAHRRADDVRAADVERFHQPDDVVRHLVQRVRRLDRPAGDERLHRGEDVRNAGVGEDRRPADVAVVEPDDVEAALRESGAERLVPEEHLGTETHDQQHRRRGRVAAGIVLELDVVDAGARHRGSISGARRHRQAPTTRAARRGTIARFPSRGAGAICFAMPVPPFGSALRARVSANLAAHDRLATPIEDRRAAAVALTLVRGDDGDDACFLLTRRAPRLRAHAGQWALPGGRLDRGESAAAAALRELREEVGLTVGDDDVLGYLDDYATRSGYVITPVVVWGGESAALAPNPIEVAAVYRVPLAILEAPEVPRVHYIPESERPVIAIPMMGTHVHAPTAAIVYQLREVAVHGRGTRVAHFEQPVFAWR